MKSSTAIAKGKERFWFLRTSPLVFSQERASYQCLPAGVFSTVPAWGSGCGCFCGFSISVSCRHGCRLAFVHGHSRKLDIHHRGVIEERDCCWHGAHTKRPNTVILSNGCRLCNLPEQGASFATTAATTGFHAVRWNPVNTTIGHKSQTPDLEPIAQTDQLDAFPFRE